MIAENKTLVSLASANEDASWVKMEMASMHQSDRISIVLNYTSASGCSHESCKLHQIRVPSIPQNAYTVEGKRIMLMRIFALQACSNSRKCWSTENCQRNEIAIHLQLLWCINLIEISLLSFSFASGWGILLSCRIDALKANCYKSFEAKKKFSMFFALQQQCKTSDSGPYVPVAPSE